MLTEVDSKPGETVICTGKIKHVGSTYVDQWNYLKNLLPKEKQSQAKLTLAAPNWYHLRYKTGRAYPKDVYSSDAEYFADISKAYRDELKILYDNGLRNVQIDDPNLACMLLPFFTHSQLTSIQISALRKCSRVSNKTAKTPMPSSTPI